MCYSIIRRLALVVTVLASVAACRDTNPLAPDHVRRVPAVAEALLGNPIVSLTAGAFHTCALRQNGTAYCWGRNEFGQLGIGSSPTTCGGWACADVPTLITTMTFSWLAAGTQHSCGLATDHTAWCWGKNDKFQLGTGDNSWWATPHQTARGVVFNSIFAGDDLTCGTAGGTLQCWGQMPDGQQWHYPWELVVANTNTDFQNGGIGRTPFSTHVCTFAADPIMDPTPVMRCWGNNAFGQTGVDTGKYVAPFAASSVTPNSTPAAGNGFTCVDDALGVVCFGDGTHGQLGNANFLGQSSSVPVRVLFRGQLHGVVAGDHHACALDSNGNAFCWGKNDFMQVGSSQLGDVASPIMVGGGLSFTKLVAGEEHTCGLTTARQVFCWGDDYFGQLGDQQHFLQQFFYNSVNDSALPIHALGT